MNWEAEMDKPLFVKKGGGFVTLRQALELRRNEAKGVVEALLEEQEHIVAATVRSPSGKLYNDTNHGSAYMTAAEEMGCDVDDIFAEWAEGFLTNTGRFVDRDEAYKIAMAAKQHRPADQKDPNEPWLEYAEVEQDPRFWPKELWPQQESVAVDLDGTLARDSGWKGPEHIGEPVKPMLDLVKKLLDDGEDVVIFTARVHDGEKSTKDHIKQWLKDHDLPDLEITNEKRPDMEKFYDDKAVSVKKNKGVSESKLPWSHSPAVEKVISEHNGRVRVKGSCGDWLYQVRSPDPSIPIIVVDEPCAKHKARLAEALLLESPTLKTLQKNKVDLEPDERKQIMKAKAVWPFGKKGADSPAVHKAVVKGKPWYWSSTHRLYHVDSTVAAAIKNFFKIVEPSG